MFYTEINLFNITFTMKGPKTLTVISKSFIFCMFCWIFFSAIKMLPSIQTQKSHYGGFSISFTYLVNISVLFKQLITLKKNYFLHYCILLC